MIPVLDLTETMARRADRYDRSRLAKRATGAKEAARLRECRVRFTGEQRA
jgi:hypothetical protein